MGRRARGQRRQVIAPFQHRNQPSPRLVPRHAGDLRRHPGEVVFGEVREPGTEEVLGRILGWGERANR